ncbi:MAG: sulfite exporter TauE/SafE family protein [Actinomycetota bacterium]
MRRRLRTKILLAFCLTLFSVTPVSAHPELVFYIDTSATVHSKENTIFLDYYIAKSDQIAFADLALADGDIDLLAKKQCTQALNGMQLSIGNFQLPLVLNSSLAIENLSTTGAGTWVDCKYSSKVDIYGENQFTWRDNNFPDTPGHREFNVGLSKSPSSNLTDYTSVLTLLDQRSANFSITFPDDELALSESIPKPKPSEVMKSVAPTPKQSDSNDVDSPAELKQSWLTTTSNRYFRTLNPTPIIVTIGILIAFLLGALHSIAPGHGKSIMAVMALAESGKRRELIKLGFAMGATHTVGVLILGSIFIFGSSAIPRKIIPSLGVVSGFLISAIGGYYVLRFLSHQRQHRHHEEHHHHHAEVRTGRIALLGLVGGMVPTPTAITILVGTAALGSAWYGVLLVTSYGMGMTSILIFAGQLVERLYRWAERVSDQRLALGKIVKNAPLAAASLQVIAGMFLVVISYQALT